jgi:6-phosphogluconolactonase
MTDNQILKIFSHKEQLAERLADDLVHHITGLIEEKNTVNIALSGGSTPGILFRELTKFASEPIWEKVRLFWVDERCVPPDHAESNYGVAKSILLDPLEISPESVYRIKGENDAQQEAELYEEQIRKVLSSEHPTPVFDVILLGMGEDGHTASIFPDQIHLWDQNKLCVVGIHPETGQERVSFTGKLINAANRVIFMVTGKNKAEVVFSIINKTNNYLKYPASLVNPARGKVEWFLDQEAASLIEKI